MMEAMINKEQTYVLAAMVVSLCSFWLLSRFAASNSTISGNLAESRIAGQDAINTVLSLQNQGKPIITIGSVWYTWSEVFDQPTSLRFCKNAADPNLSCMDFVLTTCPDEIASAGRPCLRQSEADYTHDVWSIPGGKNLYSRKIRITDVDTQGKKITVLIWWSDDAGFHNSPISRIIPYQK